MQRRQVPPLEARQEILEFKKNLDDPYGDFKASDFVVTNVHFIHRKGSWRIASLSTLVSQINYYNCCKFCLILTLVILNEANFKSVPCFSLPSSSFQCLITTDGKVDLAYPFEE